MSKGQPAIRCSSEGLEQQAAVVQAAYGSDPIGGDRDAGDGAGEGRRAEWVGEAADGGRYGGVPEVQRRVGQGGGRSRERPSLPERAGQARSVRRQEPHRHRWAVRGSQGARGRLLAVAGELGRRGARVGQAGTFPRRDLRAPSDFGERGNVNELARALPSHRLRTTLRITTLLVPREPSGRNPTPVVGSVDTRVKLTTRPARKARTAHRRSR